MSRWWAETLRCRVAPADALADAPAGLAPTAAGSARAAPVDPVASALAAWDATLDARAPRRGTRVHAVIGGPLARHRIVPWNPTLRGEAQRRLFAQHAFIEAHGDLARGWTVEVDAARYGQDALACAVDTTLIDGLQAVCEARGLRLVAAESALVMAARTLRPGGWAVRRATAGPRWLLLAEPTGLTVLLIDAQGQPVLVRRLARSLVERPVELVQALERLRLTQGLEGPRGVLLPVGDWPAALAPTAAWAVQGPDEAQQRAWRRLASPADAPASVRPESALRLRPAEAA